MVIKRDGSKVNFNKDKIVVAISKAHAESKENLSQDIINEIASSIEDIYNCLPEDKEMTIEQIQDIVEESLMECEAYKTARAYIRYRYKKEIAREAKTDFIDAIKEKLEGSNVQNQNANVDEHSFGGRVGEASGVVTKQLALDYIVSPMARANHLNNEIYIHDLDSYYVGSHNCLSIPFDDLLKNGFNTRQTDVRPANSVNTAFQLVAVIFQLQSLQQFGGVSATHIDWTMVPYVKKSFYKHYKDGIKYFENKELNDDFNSDLSIDSQKYKDYSERAYKYALDMTEKEVYQAVEGMYHNLNTLQSRSGNQLNYRVAA